MHLALKLVFASLSSEFYPTLPKAWKIIGLLTFSFLWHFKESVGFDDFVVQLSHMFGELDEGRFGCA